MEQLRLFVHYVPQTRCDRSISTKTEAEVTPLSAETKTMLRLINFGLYFSVDAYLCYLKQSYINVLDNPLCSQSYFRESQSLCLLTFNISEPACVDMSVSSFRL